MPALRRPTAALTATLAAVTAALVLIGCSAAGPARHGATQGAATQAAAAPLSALGREDLLLLERTGFGLDGRLLADYRRLGAQRFLEAQLRARDEPLPAVAAPTPPSATVDTDPLEILVRLQARRRAIDALPEPQRAEARKALNEEGNRLAFEASRDELLRALYSPAQLREQMVWFWLNHFSVHQYKADLRWLVADYEARAIRPHALGHFRDLVLATLEHPAMLEYLDNRQNAAGHLNENYARELMELHTLGVDAGYTQTDVQQLARVLTGVGIALGASPVLRPQWRSLYVRRGAFEFNPARHEFAPKVLLGAPVEGRGFAEVENAVSLLVHQRACARFISRELAEYFVADQPAPHLIEAMAQTFERTDGDIAAVLRTLFLSEEFRHSAGGKFKDPMRYVISSVRLAYDGRTISNTRPLLNWLNALGEAPFARQTPDGYPLIESAWASPGQMSRRFEIARAIGTGNAHLFDAETAGGPAGTGFPQLSNRLYFESLEPYLSEPTRSALERASSPQEWNTFLLCSPEFNYE